MYIHSFLSVECQYCDVDIYTLWVFKEWDTWFLLIQRLLIDYLEFLCVPKNLPVVALLNDMTRK